MLGFRLKLKKENSMATFTNKNLMAPPTSNTRTSKHTLTFNLSPTIDWNATTRDFEKSSK